VERPLEVFAVHELECAVGDDLERAEHELEPRALFAWDGVVVEKWTHRIARTTGA
jgi:hypothetical protein